MHGDRSAISRHILELSTYLGHANGTDTFSCLKAIPVLLHRVSAATERLHAGRGGDKRSRRATGGLPQRAAAAQSRQQSAYHRVLLRQLQTTGALRRAVSQGPVPPARSRQSRHHQAARLSRSPRDGPANGVRTRNVRLSAIKACLRFLEFRHPEWLDLAAQVRALPHKRADMPPVDYLHHGGAPWPSEPPSHRASMRFAILENRP